MTPDNGLAQHLPEDDLILFALQLLDEERMRQAMAHLQLCEPCRAEVASIQGDLAACSLTADPHAPPLNARERFLRQIAREPRLEEIRPLERSVERPIERSADVRPPEPRSPDPRSPESRSPARPSLLSDSTFSLMGDAGMGESRRSFSDEPPSGSLHGRGSDRPLERMPPDRLTADRTQPDRTDRTIDRTPDRTIDRPAPARDRSSERERMPERDRRPERESARASGEPVFHARQSRSLRTQDSEDEDAELREPRRRPGRAPWVLAFAGWALAAGCSFVAGLEMHQRQQMQGAMASQQARLDDIQEQAADAQQAQVAISTLTSAHAVQVALHATLPVKSAAAVKGAPPVAAPEALAAYLAEKGALVFVVTHMEPAPAGKTYELWLMPADGQSPIPAGTFKPDPHGCASVVLPQLPKGVPAKGFGVTVENDGGSLTPTLPIVMS